MAYCDRCDRYFGSQRALQQHIDDSSMHHVCYRCDRDFSTESGLTRHYVHSRSHHYCQSCEDDFDSASELASHYEEHHHYCSTCVTIFDTASGLHKHNLKEHWYCADCRRLFKSESNLSSHLRSSVHKGRTFACPGACCGKSFVSGAALVSHLESGTCPSGITRERLDHIIVQKDTSNIITNPSRLICGPDGCSIPPQTVTASWATERSWNGYRYECFLCHREYTTLAALNQHLRSAAHADKIYRCPRSREGCGTQFGTLSALCQHIESKQCGVRRFNKTMQKVIGSLANGLNLLTL